jgi:hypothetical protein
VGRFASGSDGVSGPLDRIVFGRSRSSAAEAAGEKCGQHEVSTAEAEQVFFNPPLLVLSDAKHSEVLELSNLDPS